MYHNFIIALIFPPESLSCWQETQIYEFFINTSRNPGVSKHVKLLIASRSNLLLTQFNRYNQNQSNLVKRPYKIITHTVHCKFVLFYSYVKNKAKGLHQTHNIWEEAETIDMSTLNVYRAKTATKALLWKSAAVIISIRHVCKAWVATTSRMRHRVTGTHPLFGFVFSGLSRLYGINFHIIILRRKHQENSTRILTFCKQRQQKLTHQIITN